MDAWTAIDDERLALADDFAKLNDEQWEIQSLCDQWKVRDVVGHLIFGADMKSGRILRGLIKNGMNFNRYVAHEALAIGASAPRTLLKEFRATIGTRNVLMGATPEISLVDLVCHSADIRRPTGLSRSVPPDTLLMVANAMKGIGFPIKTKSRIAGLRLSATDVKWSTGDGPAVDGPLSSLVLAMVGRQSAFDDLSGDGVATIRSRS